MIPRILKHMTLAIFKSRNVGFLGAFEIARARLVELKDLEPGSQNGHVGHIKLTSKGAQREKEKDRKSANKSHEFDRLFERYGKGLKAPSAPGSDLKVDREDQT